MPTSLWSASGLSRESGTELMEALCQDAEPLLDALLRYALHVFCQHVESLLDALLRYALHMCGQDVEPLGHLMELRTKMRELLDHVCNLSA